MVEIGVIGGGGRVVAADFDLARRDKAGTGEGQRGLISRTCGEYENGFPRLCVCQPSASPDDNFRASSLSPPHPNTPPFPPPSPFCGMTILIYSVWRQNGGLFSGVSWLGVITVS